MRRINIAVFAVAVGLWINGCQMLPTTPSAEAVLEQMRQAQDPDGKLPAMKTAVFVFKSVSKISKLPAIQPEKSEIIISMKSPNMIRYDIRSPDNTSIFGYNGKHGWAYDSDTGLRQITGRELDELRFQGIWMMSGYNKNIFSHTSVNGSEPVNGEDCWELTCVPLPKYNMPPTILFISKKSRLPLKTIEQSTGTVVTFFRNYRTWNNIMLPDMIVTKSDGLTFTCELISAAWGPILPDSIFEPPLITTEK